MVVGGELEEEGNTAVNKDSEQAENVGNSDDAAPPPQRTTGRRKRVRQSLRPKIKIQKFDAMNWRLYQLYHQQNYDECEKIIAGVEEATYGLNSYALFIKGMIHKAKGEIAAARECFERGLKESPSSKHMASQLARCMFLQGEFTDAVKIYDRALAAGDKSWRTYHDKAICYVKLGQLDEAETCLGQSLALHKTTDSYKELAKVRIQAKDYAGAVQAYNEALKIAPEDTAIMTELGLLQLKLGNSEKAFRLFGTCLAYNPKDTEAILALGSIVQNNEDYDVALVKYRVSAALTPESAEVWNNIGMCFFGKKKYIAAIACLKRAAYLAPFEWMVAFNLGLVHLTCGQPASAFHFLSASINLRPTFSPSFAMLGATLHALKDYKNAVGALKQALDIDPNNPLTALNLAIAHAANGELQDARERLTKFASLISSIPHFKKENPDAVLSMQQLTAELAEKGNQDPETHAATSPRPDYSVDV